jgi:membrane associated rhomboid family serine protease
MEWAGTGLMIIPYGHEHSTVRRLPWVSFGLMGVCVLVFLLTSLAGGTGASQADDHVTELFEYLSSHPYLELRPELERVLFRYIPEEEFRTFLEASRALAGDPPSHPGQIQHEQAELDRIADRVLRALEGARDSPYRRFGVVPAELQPHTLLSYQFLHGGLLHLFGNLFFLFLAGPFIEDVWGRPLFAGFYLAAGAVSALMFSVRYPELDEPLIGASGAVAGVMGAFLLRYWKTRIRFLYYFFPFRPGTFSAPAWLMLPLWFARELVFAQAWDVAAPGRGGGGVAHWAHVWGFGFGLAVAAAVAYWRIEERFIHGAIEAKITVHSNPSVERALEARAKGELERSLQMLGAAVREDPDNLDAVLALWNAAVDSGRPEAGGRELQRAIEGALRHDDESWVVERWGELMAGWPGLEVDAAFAARIIEVLVRSGQGETAAATLALARRTLGPGTRVGPLVRLARAATGVDGGAAASLARAALARPELPPELRSELTEIAAGADGPDVQSGVGSDRGSAPEREEGVVHRLQVVAAVPQELDHEALVIAVDGATRRLRLQKIEAIAVGGVARADRRPVVLVDLFLDPPWSDRRELRVVRLSSTDFDPRVLAPGSQPQEAFRAFLSRLLDLSGAAPLPDPDGARGRPFRTYSSIEDYERNLLGTGGDGPAAKPAAT